MHTGVHRFLAFELLVNPPSSGTLAFSLRLAPFLPASDSSALHAGSSASPSLAHSQFPGTSSATLPPYCLLRHSGFLTSPHASPACNKRPFTSPLVPISIHLTFNSVWFPHWHAHMQTSSRSTPPSLTTPKRSQVAADVCAIALSVPLHPSLPPSR